MARGGQYRYDETMKQLKLKVSVPPKKIMMMKIKNQHFSDSKIINFNHYTQWHIQKISLEKKTLPSVGVEMEGQGGLAK